MAFTDNFYRDFDRRNGKRTTALKNVEMGDVGRPWITGSLLTANATARYDLPYHPRYCEVSLPSGGEANISFANPALDTTVSGSFHTMRLNSTLPQRNLFSEFETIFVTNLQASTIRVELYAELSTIQSKFLDDVHSYASGTSGLILTGSGISG